MEKGDKMEDPKRRQHPRTRSTFVAQHPHEPSCFNSLSLSLYLSWSRVISHGWPLACNHGGAGPNVDLVGLGWAGGSATLARVLAGRRSLGGDLPVLLLAFIHLDLLLPALLATERHIPSVHEDVAVAGKGLAAEEARVQEVVRLLVVEAVAEEPGLGRPRSRCRSGGIIRSSASSLEIRSRRRRGGGGRRTREGRGLHQLEAFGGLSLLLSPYRCLFPCFLMAQRALWGGGGETQVRWLL